MNSEHVTRFGCVILFVISYFGYSNGELTDTNDRLRKLDLTDKLILSDISIIKREIWIEIASQIQTINERMDRLERIPHSCNCAHSENDGGNNVIKAETNAVINQDNAPRNMYKTLVNAFKAEKVRTEMNELKIETLQEQVDDIDRNQTYAQTLFESAPNNIAENSDNIGSLNASIFELQKSHAILVKDNKRHGLKTPGFVSDWFLMKSQDDNLSELLIPHELGTIPLKVQVQIKPASGPNAGWIFHGDSVFQSDDDTSKTYGGVVYLYNETHVRLFAPKKSNTGTNGVVLNTGEEDARRLGDNHQTASEALVRVKAWGPRDITPPDFKSEWLNIDLTKESSSFYNIEHAIGDYPGLVNVQIRSPNSHHLISEGVGATLYKKDWFNAGGVVWGYNDRSVRIWSSYFTDSQLADTKVVYYRPFGGNDGWGAKWDATLNTVKAKVRVLAWSAESLVSQTSKFKTSEKDIWFTESQSKDASSVSVSKDVLSLYIQANDGPNTGYRFRGYGNSQSIHQPFGGAVYAYNTAGNIRVWRPNPDKGGYLVHVHSPYGNGVNVQASNNATFVATWIKADC